MLCAWEVIKRLDRFDLIPIVLHIIQVVCKTFRIAGDIHDLLHTVSDDLFQGVGRNADTRRIHHDHLWLVRKAVQYLKHITCQKAAIVQSIESRIGLCSLHCLLHQFDTDDLFRFASQHLCDRSRSAVQIEYFFILEIIDKTDA